MTNKERLETLDVLEKKWFQSKKFIAFLIMEIVFTAILVLALKWQEEPGWPAYSFLIVVVFCMGFIAISFNSKLAHLDLFVRSIALMGEIPEELSKKAAGFWGLFAGKKEACSPEEE